MNHDFGKRDNSKGWGVRPDQLLDAAVPLFPGVPRDRIRIVVDDPYDGDGGRGTNTYRMRSSIAAHVFASPVDGNCPPEARVGLVSVHIDISDLLTAGDPLPLAQARALEALRERIQQIRKERP